MKRMLWMVPLVLALSTLALASSSVDFTSRSALTGGSSEFALVGSQFSAFSHAAKEANGLGSAAFSTATGFNGNLRSTNAVASNWFNGSKFNGVSQSMDSSYLKGSAIISSSAMCHTMVPEPGTLGLLGTGLVGLAGVLRLRSKA